MSQVPLAPILAPHAKPFNFSHAVVRDNPFPFYAALRERAPFFRITQGSRGDSVYVMRYDDVLTLLRDADRFANDKRSAGHSVSWLEAKMSMGMNDAMVMRDDLDHRRLRSLVHKAFTPTRIASLDGHITRIADGLVRKLEGRTEVDLIRELALPLPLEVISDMMAILPENRSKFHRWMNGFMELDGDVGLMHLLSMIPKVINLNLFLRREITQRRASKGDDLLSAMVMAEEAGDKLNYTELVAAAFIILLAGHETTVNLIGNGVLALIENPEQMQKLRARPELVESAVEELLRFTSPVQINAPRYVREDTELAGVFLAKGTSVSPVLGSANHDETQFKNAHVLDVERAPNKHLSFGYGVHFCLGASLARLEAKAAILALLRTFSSITLAVPRSQLRWRESNAIRGLASLPLFLR